MNVPLLVSASAVGLLTLLAVQAAASPPAVSTLPTVSTLPAAATSQDETDLARRVAELEARVTELESGTRRTAIDPGATGATSTTAAAAAAAARSTLAAQRLAAAQAALDDARSRLVSFRAANGVIDLPAQTRALLDARFDLDRKLVEGELEEQRAKAHLERITHLLQETPADLDEVTPAQLVPNPLRAQMHERMLSIEGQINQLELDTTGGQAVLRRNESVLRTQLDAMRQRFDNEPIYVEQAPERRVRRANPRFTQRRDELEVALADRDAMRDVRQRLVELREEHSIGLERLQGKAVELGRLERAQADAERAHEAALAALLATENR